MSRFKPTSKQRPASAALLCLTVIAALLFSTAGTAKADENPRHTNTPGITEISFQDVAFVDTKTGKTTRIADNIAAVPSGTETGSGGWAQLFEHGCRTVKSTNKKWNYTHTQVLAKFTTHTYWCWDKSDKKVWNVKRSYEADIAGATFMEKVGISHNDGHFYDWAAGYAPRSGYDNDMEYHFKNCPLNWSCGHLYLRNILRAHSNGTWTWRTEN